MLIKINHWILEHFLAIAIGLILGIHLILHLAGIPQSFNWGFHILGLNHLEKYFFTNLFYFHASPPLLSLIHYLAFLIGDRHLALTVLLALLHGLSFYWFYGFCQQIKLKYAEPICLILILNPYFFIYFKNAGASTFLLVNCFALLYVLFSEQKDSRKLILITVIFAINSLLRPTWHVIFLVVLLLPFWYKVKPKYVVYSFFILLIPFGVYLKNYVLFGKFASNTQGGLNLAKAHIPPEADSSTRTVSRFYPGLTEITAYKKYINENDPLVLKYKNVEVLNIAVGNNLLYTNSQMNNIRYIQVSDMYMQDVVRNFKWRHSLTMMIQGFFVYFDSPADYDVLRVSYPSKWWTYDFFDLPNWFNIQFWRVKTKNLSLYLLVYPIAFLGLLFYFRTLKFNDWYILFILTLFSGIYMTVDYYEANRYRLELEPFWFYVVIMFCRKISATFNRKNFIIQQTQ